MHMRKLEEKARVCRLDDVNRTGTVRHVVDRQWVEVDWDGGDHAAIHPPGDRRAMLRLVEDLNPLVVERYLADSPIDVQPLRGVLSDIGCETETIDRAIRTVEAFLACEPSARMAAKAWLMVWSRGRGGASARVRASA